ncbi:MAG TPA: hypothetical protein VMT51_13475 [Dongiaceae bacterium]|nr:hypothetical protein [Dongiaceae bacterium]
MRQTATKRVSKGRGSRAGQGGFTFIELAIAIVVLLFGVVAVVELVPRALRNNTGTRQDTTSTIIAQRELEQMVLQPLNTFAFLDQDNNAINLGDPTTSGPAGSPLNSGDPSIDFTQSTVPGYSLTYVDPNDPQGATYDVRWSVSTTFNGASPIAKRFVIGVWRQGTYTQPVNLDTTVAK